MYDFQLFALGFHTHFVNWRTSESSASSLSAIGKGVDGKCPWTFLELLGACRRGCMIALPIVSFALDQWRAFRWVACFEMRGVCRASQELGRVPIFSSATQHAQTLASLLCPLESAISALRCIASLSRLSSMIVAESPHAFSQS
jgi:hypothetical protein